MELLLFVSLQELSFLGDTERLTFISVVNFIQKDLPKGSTTGAGFLIKPGSGALGMGQRASTGLTTCELKLPTLFPKPN